MDDYREKPIHRVMSKLMPDDLGFLNDLPAVEFHSLFRNIAERLGNQTEIKSTTRARLIEICENIVAQEATTLALPTAPRADGSLYSDGSIEIVYTNDCTLDEFMEAAEQLIQERQLQGAST